MSNFVQQEAAPAQDKTNMTSAVLILVIISLGNLVLALSNESFARALALIGQL